MLKKIKIKSFRFWICVTVAVYFLFCFCGVPFIVKYIVKNKVPPVISHDAYLQKVSFNPFFLRLSLRNFEIIDKDKSRLLGFEKLVVNVQAASIFKRALIFKRIEVTRPYVKVIINPQGELNLLALAPPPATEPTPAEPKKDKEEKSIGLLIDLFRVDRGSVYVREETQARPFVYTFQPINVNVQELATHLGGLSDLDMTFSTGDEGQIHLTGSLGVDPVHAAIGIDAADIQLDIFQSYISNVADLKIDQGTFHMAGQLNLDIKEGQQPDLNFTGDAGVSGLSLIDLKRNEVLAGLKQFGLKQIDFSSAANQLNIKNVFLDGLDFAFILEPETQSNINRLFPSKAPAETTKAEPLSAPPAGASTSAVAVNVEEITLTFNDLRIKDETVVPVFESTIEDITGFVRGLDTKTNAAIESKLTFLANTYGKVEIEATVVKPLTPDRETALTMKLNNYPMPAVGPYTGKFLGYGVEKGKMQFVIDYKLSQTNFAGNHNILLDQFTLGEKVESPDALKVPIKLGLSLLEDINGQIKLDVPVSGDPQSPEFKISRVVGMVFKNMFMKMLTSPFSLLAGLAGGDQAGDLGTIIFQPGLAEISDEEHAKILLLAKAMNTRPKLMLDIPGVADQNLDLTAVKTAAYGALVERNNPGRDKMDPELHRQYFKEIVGSKTYRNLRKAYKDEAKKNGADVDEEKFNQDVYRQMIAAQAIDPNALNRLAEQRGQAIYAVLTAEGQVSADRIFLISPNLDEKFEGGTVPLKLSLKAN